MEDKWGGLQQRGWIEGRVEEGMKGEEEEGGSRGRRKKGRIDEGEGEGQ